MKLLTPSRVVRCDNYCLGRPGWTLWLCLSTLLIPPRMPAVTLISAIPKFASQEEHASAVNATPNSFSEIPPLLNHQETNVLVTLEPSLEGYESAVQGTLYILTRYGVFNLWWS